MSTAEVSFTLATMQEDQMQEVREFLRAHFPADGPQNREGWLDWQAANPSGGQIQLVLEESRVVALSVFLAVRFRVGGECYSAAFSTNTMVAPELRRHGLGSRIHGSRMEAYDLALSSGQSKANARVYERMGFACLGPYRKICMVRGFPRLRFQRHYLRELFGFAKRLFRSRRLERGTRVEIYRRVPECLPRSFFDQRFSEGAIGPQPSREHVVWRYERHPYFRYEFVLVYRGEKKCGVAVIRRDGDELILVDVFAPSAEIPVVLAAVARHLRFRKAVGYFTGAELARHFAQAGWYAHMDESRLLGNTRHDEFKPLLARRDAYCFFGGDSDKDR